MSNLSRWNPRSRMLTVNDMIDQMFDNTFLMPRDGGWAANPKVDVVENDNDIVVKAEMPGFNPENIDVRIEGNMLSLRGDYNQENEKEEGQYHVRERRQSSFSRMIPLPSDVDTDTAQTHFDNGVLTLTLPKRETARSKRINVSAGNGGNVTSSSQSSQQEGKQPKQQNDQGTAQAGSKK